MGCAAAVETSSRKAEAVQEASVNLASERLTVVYDAALAQENEVLADVRQQVKRGGYKIPTLTLDAADHGHDLHELRRNGRAGAARDGGCRLRQREFRD